MNRGCTINEIDAARGGAVLVDLSGRGLIEISGEDRAPFLHGQTTNDIKRLKPGEGCYAAILTPKGRIVADMTVLCCSDRLLLDCDGDASGTITATLEKYHIMEDVRIEDVSGRTAHWGVIGPGAGVILRSAGLGDFSGLAEWGIAETNLGGVPVRVFRRSLTGLPEFDVLCPAEMKEAVGSLLMKAGPMVVGAEAIETLRIMNGVPRFGHELTDEHFPAEAGIVEKAVSFTKGCYTGQETTARIRTYGGVKRFLVRLAVAEGDAPQPGEALLHDGTEVGAVTSAARLPAGDAVALAYVRKEASQPGTKLQLPSGARAVVTAG
ncbi:MAG: folate-binding protein YgfZ [Nitrospirae bacterium]|nr:folate-binding protein YgfZ [Nitrospirota bacterium]